MDRPGKAMDEPNFDDWSSVSSVFVGVQIPSANTDA